MKHYKDAHELSGQLIEKHIKPLFDGLQKASVQYFVEKGTISGAFYEALTNMIFELLPDHGEAPPALQEQAQSYSEKEGFRLYPFPDDEMSAEHASSRSYIVKAYLAGAQSTQAEVKEEWVTINTRDQIPMNLGEYFVKVGESEQKLVWSRVEIIDYLIDCIPDGRWGSIKYLKEKI